MGHLNGILARAGGNLNKNFQKSQMPAGLPGGGACGSFDLTDTLNLELPKMEIKIRKNYLRLPYFSIANGALPP